jgi:hypothetical protein
MLDRAIDEARAGYDRAVAESLLLMQREQQYEAVDCTICYAAPVSHGSHQDVEPEPHPRSHTGCTGRWAVLLPCRHEVCATCLVQLRTVSAHRCPWDRAPFVDAINRSGALPSL